MSELIGYARVKKDTLRVTISKTAFGRVEGYESPSGEQYVGMVINLNKLRDLLNREREVTAVVTPEEESK